MGNWIKDPNTRRVLYSFAFAILLFLSAKGAIDADWYALVYAFLTAVSGLSVANVPSKEQQNTLNNG